MKTENFQAAAQSSDYFSPKNRSWPSNIIINVEIEFLWHQKLLPEIVLLIIDAPMIDRVENFRLVLLIKIHHFLA